ncbi:hypothetical protein RZS08_33835, partial [Arthrospira platensis SPKY1]|nr:hypothetical protein [Arthrospira platensis SPKY1]
IDASSDGVVGFTNFGSLANILGLAALIDEGKISSLSSSQIQVPQGLQLGAGDFTGRNRFGALISALAKDADTNVLSTPTVVTLDNEEAEIIVGQNVPFVTGTFTTATGGDGGQIG